VARSGRAVRKPSEMLETLIILVFLSVVASGS
jgi:hypothetical protein